MVSPNPSRANQSQRFGIKMPAEYEAFVRNEHPGSSLDKS
jgi:hypothetical protein